LFHKKPTF